MAGAITADQMVALLDTLRSQVEELANSLEGSRHETSDLRNATDMALSAMQEQVDTAKLAAKVDHVESDYMRLIDEGKSSAGIRRKPQGGSRVVSVSEGIP